MLARRLILVAVVALAATTATTAHAAKLGGLNAKALYAFTKSQQDAMPATLVSDKCDVGAPSLAGQASDTGQVWTVLAGTVDQSKGYLRCTTCSGGTRSVSNALTNNGKTIQGMGVVVCEVPDTSGPISRSSSNCKGQLSAMYLHSGQRYSSFDVTADQHPDGVQVYH